MGLQDFSYRLKAQSGDTTPHDEKGISPDLVGGTISLVDMGSGDFAWQFASGRASTTSPVKVYNGATTGGGVTIAIRMAVTTYDASSFAFLAGWGTDTTPTKGLALGQNGTNVVRGRWADASNDTLSMLTVNTAVRTYVLRQTNNSGSSLDKIAAWVSGVTGTGDNPDYLSSGQNAAELNSDLDTLFLGSSGSTIRVSDFVIWPEELTDAQCHAIANDLRGTLDVAGGDATAGGVTLTPAASMIAGSASGTGEGSASGATVSAAVSLVAGSAVGGSTGTLTIGPLKNNTGTTLASETGITAHVYALGGALVVTKSAQTTSAGGILTLTDAAIVPGTTYRTVIVMAGGAEGLDKRAAA